MAPNFTGTRSAAAALLVTAALAGPAVADPVADFYRGKTLRVVVGYGPGGGYDLYGRVFSQYFGKFMVGNPTVVAQNMPGAGSLVATRYLHNVAPKDGTVFGSVTQTLALESAMAGPGRDFDAGNMPYIGRFTGSVDLGLGLPGMWFKTFQDARDKEIVVGASGTAATSYLLPAALNRHGGAKFKIIAGFKGSTDILIAAERKEVEFVGSINLSVIMLKFPEWVTQGKAPILYQGGLKRHPLLPNVPALPELGVTADGKLVLTAIAGATEVGRAINTTPGVPPERVAALRKAFAAMMKDKEFLAEMEKRRTLIEFMPGEEVDKITKDMLALPKKIIDQAAAIMKPPVKK
jgi:tripartite-type tricarboxylate transporter receptor subunit TctC